MHRCCPHTIAHSCSLCLLVALLVLVQPTLQNSSQLEQTTNVTEDMGVYTPPQVTGDYLQNIFDKYGGQDGRIDFNSFKTLLSSVGFMDEDHMDNTHDDDHHDDDHDDDDDHEDEHDDDDEHSILIHSSNENTTESDVVESHSVVEEQQNAMSSESNVRRRKRDVHDYQMIQADNRRNLRSKRAMKYDDQCLTPSKLLSKYDLNPAEGITRESLMDICPAIIFQLDICDNLLYKKEHIESVDAENRRSAFDIPFKVWGCSLLAVVVISMVGLLGVAMVPIIQKVFYNHVLQFLISVAIGSLVGDALLHLLPHAILAYNADGSGHGSHGEGDEDEEAKHKQAIYLGLVALLGIYFFFMTERVMALVLDRYRRINKAKKKSSEINGDAVAPAAPPKDTRACDEMIVMVHTQKDLQTIADEAHNEMHQGCKPDEDKRDVYISHSHGHSHGGNGHGELPRTVAAVAWMVIMGDGLHNLCDGLAIGAAFSSGMSGGISTSVAVFCHELPHELGDFAVLLHAGMTVKQALVYNIVSSVLCLIGMVIGLLIGNQDQALSWVLALAAGMFIYIALVDMLPALTGLSPQMGENPLFHLVLQNIGMMIGAFLMLIIALYEESIVIPGL